MKTVSIIIPVYNAMKFLPNLFKCLSEMLFTVGDEVIFIDNGSTDGSKELCEEESLKYPNRYKCLSYIEKASSYAARNYGVDHAKGDVYAFMDSDCKPEANWLDVIRGNLESGIVLAGCIILDIIENNIWECFDTIAHLQSERNAENNSVATANMAVLKEDYFRVGYFEERFSGGDYVWSNKAAACGMRIKFVPDMVVHHPTRKSFNEILRKEQRIAYGEGDSRRQKGRSFTRLILTFFLKIFKIDTNIRYSIQLKRYGIKSIDIIIFNNCFFKIRVEQLKFVCKGYRQENVRKMGIK